MPQLIGIALWAIIPAVIAGKKGRNAIGYYFLSFLITPLITTIIVICLKNLNTKNDVLNQELTRNETVLNPNVQNKFVCKQCGTYHTGWYQKCPTCGAVGKMEKAEASSIHLPPHKEPDLIPLSPTPPAVSGFCRYCGERLPEDSIFCQYCGKRLI